MDRQKVFIKVADHLRTQNHRCMGAGDTCEYLNANGLKCAIGVLIPDGHKAQEFMGGVKNLLIKFPDLATQWSVKGDLDIEFLRGLQQIHDEMPENEWPTALKFYARLHGLSYYG